MASVGFVCELFHWFPFFWCVDFVFVFGEPWGLVKIDALFLLFPHFFWKIDFTIHAPDETTH